MFDQMRQRLIEKAIRGQLVPQSDSEPVVEQIGETPMDVPYEIPTKWKWVQLNDVITLKPKVTCNDETLVSFVPMTSMSGDYSNRINSNDHRLWGSVKKGYTKFQDGDVLLARITPCFQNRKSAVASKLCNGIGTGSTEFLVCRPSKHIDADFLLYIFKTKKFIQFGIQSFQGAVGQQRVNTEELKQYLIPLPPIEEQKRIVAALETLLAEIDKTEKAHKELAGPLAEQYKALILDKAMRGQLVPQLDSELEVEQLGEAPKEVLFNIPKKWRWITLSSLVPYIVDCPHSTPKYCSTKSQYLAIDTNCIDESGQIKHWRYVTEETYQFRTSRLEPQTNDIIYTREGSIGRAAKLPENVKVCMGQRVMLIRPGDVINSTYLQLYLMSNSALCHLTKKQRGTGVKHINVSDVKKLCVPLPPLEEQRRIVIKLGQLFDQIAKLSI